MTEPDAPANAEGAASSAAILPAIPVLDMEGEMSPPLALMQAAPDRLAELIACAEARYGRAVIRAGERISRRWLARNVSPYAEEIEAVAALAGRPGGSFLNASFEWSCSCGLTPAPGGDGMRILRVLDWPLEGLGRDIVAARQRGPAGAFVNMTWPGYAGCVTGLAPGRFAAAVNQAPMQHFRLGRYGDWAVNRVRVWRSREIPPMHLLRQVFEHCTRFDDAKRALTHTPVAIPAIFVLAGPRSGQGCVIERTAHRAYVLEGPEAVANHWLTPGLTGRARGARSTQRRDAMAAAMGKAGDDLDWLAEPMLNPKTRLASVLDAATGLLVARGYEAGAPATALLRLSA
jgi:hypothetical protein